MDPDALVDELRTRFHAKELKQVEVAKALGINGDQVSKVIGGIRKLKPAEMIRLHEYLQSKRRDPDLPVGDADLYYVDIEVLPSFAGMGGGGTGEGDRAIAKLPRRLIEEELRGRPSDFELIDVRGDSMEPDFQHGDQILVDKRDRDPRQPGPFALWDEDGYVLKLVERVPGKRGFYRVFSANPRYSDYEVEETETTIRGRPVWFARRL